MQIASCVMFTMDIDEALTVLKIIGKEKEHDATCLNPKSNRGFQAVELFIDGPEYARLIEELTSRGVKYKDRFRKVYTIDELEAAEYLRMIGGDYWGYPQPDDRHPGYRQLSYDLSTACPLCGNGARQCAPLRLKKAPHHKRKEWLLLHWVYEYLVTDRVADLIRQAQFTGCSFRPLLHHRTEKEIPGWKQLVFEHELPPMSAKTEFPLVTISPERARELNTEPMDLCPCGKRGRNQPETVYYDRADIIHFQDFNMSHEWLGGGCTTWPMQFISQRVFRFCRENNLDPADLEPVEWV